MSTRSTHARLSPHAMTITPCVGRLRIRQMRFPSFFTLSNFTRHSGPRSLPWLLAFLTLGFAVASQAQNGAANSAGGRAAVRPRAVPVPHALMPARTTPLPANASPSPAAGATPSATMPPRAFGRTFVVLLGGVSWEQWAALGARTNSAMPGFRRILEEGALAAVRLPGAWPQPSPSLETGAAYSVGRALSSPSPAGVAGVSDAVLRAAAILSAGTATPVAGRLPAATALTLSATEHLPPVSPWSEDDSADVIFTRRTGTEQVPLASRLLNLGLGATASPAPADATLDANPKPLGQLGDMVYKATGRTAAFGSADTSILPDRGLVLREWALVAVNGAGVVDTGDVSRDLLQSDFRAPFGVRANSDALLMQLDVALNNQREQPVALVTIEWGDTRRAALYAPLCAPDAAAKHRDLALRRADVFLQELLRRLPDPRDRLIVLALPDLDTNEAQWLPLAYWQPQRRGQGALLHSPTRGEVPGVIRLEDITATLAVRLNMVAPPALADPTVVPLVERGQPATAAPRLHHLLALQFGMARLDAARPLAHMVGAALIACALLAALSLVPKNGRAGTDKGEAPDGEEGPAYGEYGLSGERRPGGERRSRGERRAARGPQPARARVWWCAAMVYPLLLWIVGFCVQAAWRSDAGANSAIETGAESWLPPLIWLGVTLVMVVTAILAWAWFDRGRLRGLRVGVLWCALTLFGVLVGGFALPWNALVGASLPGDTTARIGDFWSLLLISATLLGIASLTRVPRPNPSTSASRGARPDEGERPGNKARFARLQSALLDEMEDEPVRNRRTPARRRVLNVRPAVLWMIAVVLLLAWGHNGAAVIVAVFAFGTLWLRLWLERAMAGERLRRRRWVIGGAAGLAVLLLWQRGGTSLIENTLVAWWPHWQAAWGAWWWGIALIATLSGGLLFVTSARAALRSYLEQRYSVRAMLAGAAVGAIASLAVFGPMGPPLIALYTLGAVFYEVLGLQP
jgi:hypothetical protein